MIDLVSERLVALTQVPKLSEIPKLRGGKRPHVATIYRWAQNGVRGVKLETVRLGGTVCTSVEAIQRFVKQLSDPNATTSPSPTKARQRQVEAAERQLSQAGI